MENIISLKNISVKCGDKIHFGEVVITATGLEGSGIYPLSPQIRKELDKKIYNINKSISHPVTFAVTGSRS